MIGFAMMLASDVYYGGFYSGDRLYERCRSTNAMDQMFCAAYFTAVIDTIEVYQGSGKPGEICVSKDVTPRKVADVALPYLEKHRELRPRSASALIRDALLEAWACPKT